MRAIYYGPRDRSKKHEIPIYDVHFELVLCADVARAHNQAARLKKLGNDPWTANSVGLVSYEGSNCVMLLKRDALSHRLIAHECRHAADFIMTLNQVKFGPKSCHETAALIQEYIAGIVYDTLKAWKAKIK